MDFKRIALDIQQAGPVVALGDGRGLVERRARLLIGHLEKEQKRQLFDVVAIGESIIAEDVAVVPEFLDDAVRCHYLFVTPVT